MNENDILTATGDELTGYGVAAILIFFIFIGLGLAGAYYAQVWIIYRYLQLILPALSEKRKIDFETEDIA